MSADQEHGWIAFGPIQGFRGGWAKFPFVGQRAHYWEEVHPQTPLIHKGERVRVFDAACGVEGFTAKGMPALNEGSCPRCKNCERRLGNQAPR